MASITTWSRIEASTREQSVEEGLEARTADPLWLLARQWQLGEFLGEDAATPIKATIRYESTSLARIRLRNEADGSAIVAELPSPLRPLEAIVERESVWNGPSLRQRALESGQHFLRILGRHGVNSPAVRQWFRDAFPFGMTDEERALLDPGSKRFMEIMIGRVPDGLRLRMTLDSEVGEDRIAADTGVGEDEIVTVKAALSDWKTWHDGRFTEPDEGVTGWVRERMEYAFEVSAPLETKELVLEAPEYHGGHLDWYAFDVAEETSLDGSPRLSTSSLPKESRIMPTLLSYPGMPASRFWQFEDAAVNLTRYSAGPADISKFLLVEFAMVYGNDWFRVPLDHSDLSRIVGLVVRDNFDSDTTIQPATQVDGPDPSWRMFVMAGDPALAGGEWSPKAGTMKGPWLFRPPSLARSLNSDALEEVVLARDEMANLAWAIERTVECATGKPVSRMERWLSQRQAAAGTATEVTETTDARYRAQTTVPDYWLPLVPVPQSLDNASIIFRRGRALLPSGDPAPKAKGRILDPGRKLLIHEEEVPKQGVIVARHWQLARWVDGSTWLWLARRKAAGRGEKSSGLRYDLVEE